MTDDPTRSSSDRIIAMATAVASVDAQVGGLRRALDTEVAALRRSLDEQARQHDQLVSLFGDRMAVRFDSVDQRLAAMDAARLEARNEGDRQRSELATQLKAVSAEAKAGDAEVRHGIAVAEADRKAQAERFDARLAVLERFNARLAGFAVGVSLLTGGTFAAVLKALGALK